MDDVSVVTASPTALTDKNLFAYCDNNPVIREDTGGEFWDLIFDVGSFVASVVDVISDPTDGWAWAGLAGDVVDVAIPFVGGIGEITRGARAINKLGNVADSAHDAGKITKKIDYYITPAGDAIPATRKVFDENLSKMELKNKKYYGYDSRGPVRVRVEKHNPTFGYNGPNDPYHCNPHFHIDRREGGSSGPFKKVFTGLMEWLK